MKKTCSDKIVFSNYVLMCLIVILHSDNRSVSDYGLVSLGGGYDSAYRLLNNLATMAVPIFFALSGYLYFRNCNWNTIGRKLGSRVKTILVPYLFWNMFFYGVYGIINEIPIIGNKINFEMPEVTLKVLLFDQYANPPLWFLPKLFLLQLCTPVGLWLFQKLKRLNLIWIFLLIVTDILVDFGYSNPIHWISIFYGAGYISYFYSAQIENLSDSKVIPKPALYCIVLAFFVLQSFYLKWLFAPLFWLCLMVAVKNVPTSEFMKTSFFIFCTHYFFVLTVRKIVFLTLGASNFAMFICYILTFSITIVILSIMGMFFRKNLPRLYSVLCGGR